MGNAPAQMADIPTSEPASARAGDTWRWTRSLTDYPASAWTLKYRFRHPSNAGFEIVAAADGADHAVTTAASTTAAFVAGTYSWISWVEGGSSEKYTVGEGEMEVLPDYRAAAAGATLDDRSHARKMLESIESWLENRNPAVAEYEIAGRRMRYIPIAELIKLRNRYSEEIAAEDARRKLARGEGVGRRIQFRI